MSPHYALSVNFILEKIRMPYRKPGGVWLFASAVLELKVHTVDKLKTVNCMLSGKLNIYLFALKNE